MASGSIFSEDKIMIVDDTESFALCVKTFLELEGYEVIKIFNCPGKALAEIQRQGCPAFIISDYEMPAMTGAALLESIRQRHPRAQGVIITCHQALPPEVAGRFTVIRKDEPDFFGLLLSHLRKAQVPAEPCR
jgi:DNA-binding NtrC family response regulator